MFTIYVLSYCGYCNAALQLFDKYKIAYKKINVIEEKKQYYKKLNNMSTFPQISVKSKGKKKMIGGYDDLSNLLETTTLINNRFGCKNGCNKCSDSLIDVLILLLNNKTIIK
jgi:glutaredoxin